MLDDPELYSRDPAKFAKASEAFAALQADIAKSEDEWLALEIKREEERSN
jgi:ATP-binding cassette subfamily F protein uup